MSEQHLKDNQPALIHLLLCLAPMHPVTQVIDATLEVTGVWLELYRGPLLEFFGCECQCEDQLS